MFDEPPGVDTWTSTSAFPVWAGEIARMEVSLNTVNDDADDPTERHGIGVREVLATDHDGGAAGAAAGSRHAGHDRLGIELDEAAPASESKRRGPEHVSQLVRSRDTEEVVVVGVLGASHPFV